MHISPSNLIRWSGIAAIVGGILVVATRVAEIALFGRVPSSVIATSDGFLAVGILGLAGTVLPFLGIVGWYARAWNRTGPFGLITFLTSFIGTGLALGVNWTYAFALPALAEYAPAFVDANYPGLLGNALVISYAIAQLGWVLMGISILATKVLPRWSGVVIILSVVLIPLLGLSHQRLPLLTNILIGAGPIALGWALWMVKDAART